MIRPTFYRAALLILFVAFIAAGCASKQKYTDAAEGGTASSEKNAASISSEANAASEGTTTTVKSASIAGDSASQTLLNRVRAEGLLRVNFEFDQYILSQESRDILTADAAFLAEMEQLKVLVEGHADERGSDEYNLALGERRALAAKNFLVSVGVDEDRLSIISYGEEKPLAAGHSESDWSKNRRAELTQK